MNKVESILSEDLEEIGGFTSDEINQINKETDEEIAAITSKGNDWPARLDSLGKELKDRMAPLEKLEGTDFTQKFLGWVECNQGSYANWIAKIWELLGNNYSRISTSEDAIADTTVSDSADVRQEAIEKLIQGLRVGKYNPFHERATSLSHFVISAIKKNERTLWKKRMITGHRELQVLDDDKGDDSPIQIPSGGPGPEELIAEENFGLIATTMMMNFRSMLSGMQSQRKAALYPFYRMWYSELTEQYIKDEGYLFNLHDVTKALDFAYLLFYLMEPKDMSAVKGLRAAIQWVKQAPLKDEVPFLDKMIPVKVHDNNWLFADVPRSYMERTTGKMPTTERIGKTRNQYLDALRQMLKEEEEAKEL